MNKPPGLKSRKKSPVPSGNSPASSKLYLFKDYYLGAFIQPRRVFETLLTDGRRLKFGVWAVAINALLYTFVYLFLIFGGGQPYKPWLAIPSEIYYRYNLFFLAPSMFLGWILAAGVVQLLSRPFSGTGSFEDNLSVFGFGIGIASWSTLLHDLVTSFLGAVHIMNQRSYETALNSPTVWRTLLWILMISYLIWFMAMFTKGIQAAQRLRRVPAVFLGVTAFLVYQIFFFIFNR